MSDLGALRQALETLRLNSGRFTPDVLATITAVLEAQVSAADGGSADGDSADSASEGQVPQTDRRPVTVLFAEATGSSVDTGGSTVPAEMRALWRRLDQIITIHGGTVDKHMGDVVMAVFGVPKAAENDAERAVRCALALSQLVEMTPTVNEALAGLTMRAGINTGPVSVGTVGSDGGITVIGDAVNVASRLREWAEPGSVIIGETTFGLIEPFYEVESLGSQVIKGRQTPVTAYRVIAARPRLFFTSGRGIEGVSTAMVGRQTELAHLQAAVLTAVDEGRGQTVLITGEAGVGKSRLAAELNAWLAAAGPDVVVFQGRSEQRLQRMSFGLWRDLLTSYFGILDSDAPDVTEARLLEALQSLRGRRENRFRRPSLFRERVRAVARLVGLDLPPITDNAPEQSPRSAVERAQEDILEFFELVAANTGAVIIFLEDIHWADRDSLDLLEKLGRLAQRTSLIVVATARPQLFDRRAGWMIEGTHPHRIVALRPLLPDDSYQLARDILRLLPDAPADLVEMIVRGAGGNPFYMEELVKVLIGDGVIIKDNRQWHLSTAQLDRLRVPATLTGVLQARLDRLPGIERTTLQQAAVIGDEFWDGGVQQINQTARDPAPAEAVAMALRSLEEREMIFRVPLSAFAGVQAYQFRHSALREVAYETILLRDRPYYHVAAAEWLEAQSGDRVVEYAAPIAEHYELAGERERAATLYEIAGTRAVSRQRPGRAAEYYGRALALLQQFPHHIDRRLTLLRSLGSALHAKGQVAEALAAYLAMEQSAQEAGDLLEQARAALALTGIYRELGQTEAMRDAAERAAQAAALTGATVELEQAQAAQDEVQDQLNGGVVGP